MMRCSGSLWSADLANLESEIRRVEPFVERFHLDVADGHYVPTLLFFPDLASAIRRCSARPLEVHLMVEDPEPWVDRFADAGATDFVLCLDTIKDLESVVTRFRARNLRLGVSVKVDEGLDLLDALWAVLDQVTIFGTEVGIKGVDMHPGTVPKVEQAKRIIRERNLAVEIEVDGGIRRHTVPGLARAGADWIVPGSLLFQDDPSEFRRWLSRLPTA